jgi:hypothetical protein
MTALSAVFIAKAAIGRDAEAVASVVETEADSVAVAVKEAGTNRTKKRSSRAGDFFVERKPRRGRLIKRLAIFFRKR